MNQIFKILITDVHDRTNTNVMLVDGLPKLFNSLEEANSFCDFVNQVAVEEKQNWRYESSLLTNAEVDAIRIALLRDMI